MHISFKSSTKHNWLQYFYIFYLKKPNLSNCLLYTSQIYFNVEIIVCEKIDNNYYTMLQSFSDYIQYCIAWNYILYTWCNDSLFNYLF